MIPHILRPRHPEIVAVLWRSFPIPEDDIDSSQTLCSTNSTVHKMVSKRSKRSRSLKSTVSEPD